MFPSRLQKLVFLHAASAVLLLCAPNPIKAQSTSSLQGLVTDSSSGGVITATDLDLETSIQRRIQFAVKFLF